MESANALYSFRAVPATSRTRTERLLMRIPIFLAVVFGLVCMMGRFVLVIREDLRQPPDSWGAVLLLAVMIGSVAFLVILACGTVGAVVGVVLRTIVRSVSQRH